MRRGELAGLEWSNINFKENLVTVNNNLIYSNGHVLMSTPKTVESCRTIYISNELLNILKKLQIRQNENKLKMVNLALKNFIMKGNIILYLHGKMDQIQL